MKARLHVRAEYGEVRIHPPYDADTLADLALSWRANDTEDTRQALAEYLRLDLDVAAAHALAQDLDGAGVKVAPF